MPEVKTQKQVDFLLGPNSPLSTAQKRRLRREIDSGKVVVKKTKESSGEKKKRKKK